MLAPIFFTIFNFLRRKKRLLYCTNECRDTIWVWHTNASELIFHHGLYRFLVLSLSFPRASLSFTGIGLIGHDATSQQYRTRRVGDSTSWKLDSFTLWDRLRCNHLSNLKAKEVCGRNRKQKLSSNLPSIFFWTSERDLEMNFSVGHPCILVQSVHLGPRYYENLRP